MKMGDNQNKNYEKKNKDKKEANNKNASEKSSKLLNMFQEFQIELDAKYDKYERLVKKGRDVTIESKRIIFLLHRANNFGNKDEILSEAKSRLDSLFSIITVDIASELKKGEVFQFLRAFSPGLQEFVEAVSFYHYLKQGNLIYLQEVCNPNFCEQQMKNDDDMSKETHQTSLSLSDILTPLDYVLGIADLTGELMRKCINSVGSGDLEEPFKLCLVLQNIYENFLLFGNSSKDMKRKLFTLKSSLLKVENACYAIKIRGTETPKHMLADFFCTDDFHENVDCDL